MKKIFFTGGHHTSALLLAKDLEKRGFQVIWLGHKFTMKEVENPSLEWQEVAKAGIRLIELKAGKIHRGSLSEKLLFVRGFIQSLGLILKFRPVLIVSFGGYLAVPAVLAGTILRVPSVTHEQTVGAGLANRFLKYLVKWIFVSWPDSLPFFPKEKTVLVGLPLREEIIKPPKMKFFLEKKKIVLITGGKQGSYLINMTIKKILPHLLEKYNLIHQTGETTTTNDLEDLTRFKNKLPKGLQKGYQLKAYLTDKQMGAALNQASCVVCRSGAHTVYELLALAKPAVLIPLPFSFADEQRQNAEKLFSVGLAKVIEQKELTPEKLLEAISKQIELKKKEKINQRARKLVSLNARKEMLDYLLKFLN